MTKPHLVQLSGFIVEKVLSMQIYVKLQYFNTSNTTCTTIYIYSTKWKKLEEITDI